MEPARRPPLPWPPDAGPFQRGFWRSPLRGPWLASILSSALLVLLAISALTGFLSHAAYDPELGGNAIFGDGPPLGFDVFFFDWPTSPAWLYAATQGLHIASGLAAIPILLAKLWTVIPKLFERPAARSIAHLLERLSLALLVGSGLFVLFTGVLNIQYFYPWAFNFVAAHYYGSVVFVAALAVHVALKLATLRRAFRERGVLAPLRQSRAETVPEPDLDGLETSAPSGAATATISRRALLGTVGLGSVGLALMAAGQTSLSPFRGAGLLAPRARELGSSPNDFPVNQTAADAGISRAATGGDWRLEIELGGTAVASLTRAELGRMPQRTERLPIACVEGWSTTEEWTGVPLAELGRLAGVSGPAIVTTTSIEEGSSFAAATFNEGQTADLRTLLALKVNGSDLGLDHGYPARVIGPALPGVHCTKWVGKLSFEAA